MEASRWDGLRRTWNAGSESQPALVFLSLQEQLMNTYLMSMKNVDSELRELGCHANSQKCFGSSPNSCS